MREHLFGPQTRLLRTKSHPNNKRTIKNSYGGNFKIGRLCCFCPLLAFFELLTPLAACLFKSYLVRIFHVFLVQLPSSLN